VGGLKSENLLADRLNCGRKPRLKLNGIGALNAGMAAHTKIASATNDAWLIEQLLNFKSLGDFRDF